MGEDSDNNVNNITKTLTDINTTIRQNIEEDCISQNLSQNVLNIIGTKVSNTTIHQQNQLEILCSLQAAFKNNVNSDVQNKIAAAIQQTAKSQGGSPLEGDKLSRNIIKIMKDNTTIINTSQVLTSIKKCILNVDQQNIINLINSDVNATEFNQVNNAVKDCLLSTNVISQTDIKVANDTNVNLLQKSLAINGNQLTYSIISSIISTIILLILISIFVPLFLPQN
jgi:hypothetical protein